MPREASEWFEDKVKKEKNIKIPSDLLKNESIDEFNRVIKGKHPIRISNFYNIKNFDLEVYEIITEKLKQSRKVYDEDKKIINKLSSIKRDDPLFFFEFIGNYYFISKILDEIEAETTLKENIKMALLIYIYLNIIEIISKAMSEIVREHIEKNHLNSSTIKRFLDSFKDGEHPEIGKLLYILEEIKFLDKKEDSIFNKNKTLRNRIAHANIYFDINTKNFYFSNGVERTKEEFIQDFILLRDFLLELIYQYNNNNVELIKSVKKHIRLMNNQFLKIGRSGTLSRHMRNFVYEWEKE